MCQKKKIVVRGEDEILQKKNKHEGHRYGDKKKDTEENKREIALL